MDDSESAAAVKAERVRDLLARIAKVSAQAERAKTRFEDLEVERDALIYEVMNVYGVSAARVADAMKVSRSYPYRLRDGYPEKRRKHDEERASAS